jgi:hypothetical protein
MLSKSSPKSASENEIAFRKRSPKVSFEIRNRFQKAPICFRKGRMLSKSSPNVPQHCRRAFRNGSPNALCQGTPMIIRFRTGPSQHDGGRFTSLAG